MLRNLASLMLCSVLALAACSEKTTAPPATPSLVLSLGSASGQITQAGTLAVPVNVTRSNFTGAVSVNATGMSGLSAAAINIPGGSSSGTLQLTADAAATPGAGALTITGAGPNGTPATSTTLALTVNVRGTYTLSAPATLTLARGTTGNLAVTVNRAGNFLGNVALNAQTPAGLSATITPASLSGTNSSATVALNAAGTMAAGTYALTLTGATPGLANQTATVNVAVTVPPAAPPFSGTIFLDPDIITASDSTTLTALAYAGQGSRTMFDRRVNGWITVNAFLFNASFNDGLTSEVQVNPEFGSAAASQTHAQRYATAIGRLPTALRRDVRTVWIHQGVQPFGGGNNNILIHVGQADLYLADGILEETLVHEASHTSLDASHAAAPGWLAAQQADPTFISTYARDNPTREDIAESFLLWLAVRHRADRISAQLQTTIQATMPNRLAYFDGLGLALHPIR